MQATANGNWDIGLSCDIRQERTSIPNALQVKEITRKPRRTQNPDKFISVASAFRTSSTHSSMPYKSKGSRKRQKPCITTKSATKKDCQYYFHNERLTRCHEPKVTVVLKQEDDRGSISNSSSTPRVLQCDEPRENQHSITNDDSALTNYLLDDLCNDHILHMKSKLVHGDPPLTGIPLEVDSTDGSGPMRQLDKAAKQQRQAVVIKHSRSVPTSLSSKSQAQLREDGRRHSDQNHVCWKMSPLRSGSSTSSGPSTKQSILYDDLSLSESNKTLSRHVNMGDSAITAHSHNAEEHLEASPTNNQCVSSMFEASILYDQWQNISWMRARITSLRFSLQNKRQDLRMLQREKSLADDAYFKQAKMRELDMPFPREWWSEKTTAELLCDCQKARDEYGSLEDEYNYLERDLDSQEYALSRHEEHFYGQLRDPSRFIPKSTQHVESPGWLNGPEYHEPQQPQELHPLVEAYFSKLGDLENSRELYDDILDEKLSLEEKVNLRKRFDMEPLTSENQEWLDSSQAQLDDLISKIKIIEEEEKELRQQCLSLGLIDEAGDPIASSKLDQSGPSLDAALAPLESHNQYSEMPPLFPPELSDSESIMKALDSENNHLPSNERFDRWSLEKLRISLHEVNIYTHCFKNYDESQDLCKLKEKICEDDFRTAWFADGFTDRDTRSTVLTTTNSTSQ
ncbi:uncharacterized protein EAF02_008021 [Botrytis sinoallii]|uniref:uncharacterized protein n=1 Tax=Botrytis sinoallii TaxID=1463999 RepID=UPI0018FF3E88|nr:uncharacterized protein EAF02_008021 [Botrytis sinoallii]KAF7879851.1 hypothetical protein EAF02_008021 [Botrytis sinoallii]